MGFCSGIENYSRHLTGRAPGEPPPTLLDYFPSDWLLFIDESHVTVPQIGGMYRGDRSRKETLVEYGFRLPSALDNRPLNFQEFDGLLKHAVYVSATPGDYELRRRRRRGGRAVDPAHRADGSGGHRAAGGAPGGRSAGGDPGADRAQRAGPGHDADEEDGRGPDRLLPRAGCARALPALRHRDARAGGHHSRPAPRRCSTSSSASTCCARGSTCPRCRWWRSSTPTRRASCARSVRSSRPSAGRRATSTGR